MDETFGLFDDVDACDECEEDGEGERDGDFESSLVMENSVFIGVHFEHFSDCR